jgi:hypothetical protein
VELSEYKEDWGIGEVELTSIVPDCSKSNEREFEDGDDTLRGKTAKDGEADIVASKYSRNEHARALLPTEAQTERRLL